MSDALNVDDVGDGGIQQQQQTSFTQGGGGGGFAPAARANVGVAAAVSRERRRALASARSGLVMITIAYILCLGLSLSMLLCIDITLPMFWGTWQFWRYFSTVVGLFVPIIIMMFVNSTCEPCGTARPSSIGIFVMLGHIVWCLVITGFVANDIINCSTTSWCVGPSGGIGTYFLIWAIGYWVALFLEIVIVFSAWRVLTLATAGCQTRCETRLAARGWTAPVQSEFMLVKGLNTPVSTSASRSERGLLFSEHDVAELHKTN